MRREEFEQDNEVLTEEDKRYLEGVDIEELRRKHGPMSRKVAAISRKIFEKNDSLYRELNKLMLG